MCKVTQFFNSKKVGVDAVDEVFFLFHYIWNIAKLLAMAIYFYYFGNYFDFFHNFVFQLVCFQTTQFQ